MYVYIILQGGAKLISVVSKASNVLLYIIIYLSFWYCSHLSGKCFLKPHAYIHTQGDTPQYKINDEIDNTYILIVLIMFYFSI